MVLLLAGTIGVFRAEPSPAGSERIAQARAFIAARGTGSFRGSLSVKANPAPRSPLGPARTLYAQVRGELAARGKTHAVIADDNGATELVLTDGAVYVRTATTEAALPASRYIRADAHASRLMRFRAAQAKTFEAASVLAAATNAKILRRSPSATTVEADVTPAVLFGRKLSRHVQWVTIRAVIGDAGALQRLQVVTRAQAATVSRVEFDDWGDDAIRVVAPATAQVDTTPPIASAALAAFPVTTPLLMPKALPAGWELVRARVLAGTDTEEGCAQAELAYEDQTRGDFGYLYLYELPASCAPPAPPGATPFTAGSYTGFSGSDDGPYVQIAVGRTTVQAVSDLPRPELAKTLSAFVPLALRSS